MDSPIITFQRPVTDNSYYGEYEEDKGVGDIPIYMFSNGLTYKRSKRHPRSKYKNSFRLNTKDILEWVDEVFDKTLLIEYPQLDPDDYNIDERIRFLFVDLPSIKNMEVDPQINEEGYRIYVKDIPEYLIPEDTFFEDHSFPAVSYDSDKIDKFLDEYSLTDSWEKIEKPDEFDLGFDYDEDILDEDPQLLPYKDFNAVHIADNLLEKDKKELNTKNCLINFIINKHGRNTKTTSNKFSVKHILSYFKKGDSYVTTIKQLKHYVESKNSFVCILADVYGRIIYSYDPRKFTKNLRLRLPAIRAIIYNKHIYEYTSKKKFSVKFKEGEQRNTENNVYIDNNTDFTDNEFVDKFNTQTLPNFIYKAEEPLYMTSLRYCDPNIEEVYDECQTLDMNSAYYNLFVSDNLCRVFPESPIPVFSCIDKWEKYTDQKINSYDYIVLNNTDKTEEYGVYKNLMHGFTFEIFSDKGILTRDDVAYIKKPSNTVALEHYHKVMEKLDDQSTKTLGDKFRLCNGIMNKTRTTAIPKTAKIHDDPQYTELLKSVNRENDMLVEGGTKEGVRICTLVPRRTKHLYLNSRSFYNYIVDRTNAYLLFCMFKFKKVNKYVVFHKIVTDSFTFRYVDPSGKFSSKFIRKKFKLEKCFNFSLWKLEEKPLKMLQTHYHPVNIERINKAIEEERKTVLANIEIIQGAPGAGKTHLVKNSKKYDYASTLTNMCCRNLDTEDKKGITFYKLFGLTMGTVKKVTRNYHRFRNKTIWIDEFSMLKPQYYDLIYHVAADYNTKFILTGDPNQVDPPGYKNTYKDCPLSIQTNLTNLTTNYRNDEKMLKIRDDILTDKKLFLSLINTIPYRPTKRYTHICFTNQYRAFINQSIMERYNYTFTSEYVSNIPIICKSKFTNKEHAIFKNEVYYVIDSNEKNTKISTFKDPPETNSIRAYMPSDYVKIPTKSIKKHFVAAFAITTHAAQGSTIKKVCIHESRKMNKKLLYTAFTRGETLKDVKFMKPSNEFKPYKDYTKNECKTVTTKAFDDIYD